MLSYSSFPLRILICQVENHTSNHPTWQASGRFVQRELKEYKFPKRPENPVYLRSPFLSIRSYHHKIDSINFSLCPHVPGDEQVYIPFLA